MVSKTSLTDSPQPLRRRASFRRDAWEKGWRHTQEPEAAWAEKPLLSSTWRFAVLLQGRCSASLPEGRMTWWWERAFVWDGSQPTPALSLWISFVDSLQYCFDLGNWHTLRCDITCLITAETLLTTHQCKACLVSQFYFLLWALQSYIHAILAYTKLHFKSGQSVFIEKKSLLLGFLLASVPRTQSLTQGTCSPLMCQTKVHGFVLLKMNSWLFMQFPMSHSTPLNYFWQM